MNIGMMWEDDSKKRVKTKIQEAVDYFYVLNRWGYWDTKYPTSSKSQRFFIGKNCLDY
jgi:hypothetical protein